MIKWTEWLRENLRYPNSENSRDEARYTEIYEEKILEIMKRKWNEQTADYYPSL